MGEKAIEAKMEKDQNTVKKPRQVILSAEELSELEKLDFLTMMAEREYM
ncbi:MAG: hypothetical protein J5778_02015 [Clostridiales bacterium]|nr:hypothetical protein [Clostridiales bacterium]